MLTQRFDGVEAHPRDAEILAIARMEHLDWPAGITRPIAVLNAAGELYRMFGAQHEPEATRLEASLRIMLGMVNRIGWDDAARTDIDTLTGAPVRTYWAAVMQFGTEPWPLPRVRGRPSFQPLPAASSSSIS